MKRRQFLISSAAMATAAVTAVHVGTVATVAKSEVSTTSVTSTATTHPVRLGGPAFFSDKDPVKWVQEVRKKYRAAYAPNIPLTDTDRIKAFSAAAQEADLIFAEVGRWVNLIDTAPEKRQANIETVTDGLALAEELGARCCVDVAGSFSPTNWAGPHPKNFSKEYFDLAVENARKIIDAVKPRRAFFTLEMMPWALPDSPDSYLELIRAVDRSMFGVHVDICNMIASPRLFWDTTRLIQETFDKLGPWIRSCHAKDLKWISGGATQFAECVIGEGSIDFATYLKCVAAHPDPDLPLMMEHQKSEADYEQCRLCLLEIGRENGVMFECL